MNTSRCTQWPALAALLLTWPLINDASSKDVSSPSDAAVRPRQPHLEGGVVLAGPRAFQGYNLIAPMASSRTFLFDMAGRMVRTWESDCSPALCARLFDDGHVLRGGCLGIEAQVFGPGPGAGGRVQEFTWDGDLVWDFHFYNAKQLPHHDLARLPNGNVVLIVWDRKTIEEAAAAGRRPELTAGSHFLADSLVEIKPTGKTTGEVVWEWHLWDHLVQDFDSTKANYGNVAQHPELVDINYADDPLSGVTASKDGADQLESVGYIGAGASSGTRPRASAELTHINSVDYNAALDQLMLSVRNFSELWIIDHSTTSREAAGRTGGTNGKGGDLLYRWGNPRAYRAGRKNDQKLFAQHNAHWISNGLPGEGHVLVFNNGVDRPDGNYSSVDELVLPADGRGTYTRKPGAPYEPEDPIWIYTAPNKPDFYSFIISGAQRLANGNTLICSGASGTIFEVTPEKDVVWKYVSPITGGSGLAGGFGPRVPSGEIITPIVRTLLAVSAEQSVAVDAVQKEVDAALDNLLTDEQRVKLDEPRLPSAPRLSPGEVLSPQEQVRLELSDNQKSRLAELQKAVDAKLRAILTDAQRKQLKGEAAASARRGTARESTSLCEVVPPLLHGALKLSDEQKQRLGELEARTNASLHALLTQEQRDRLDGVRGAVNRTRPGQLMSTALQIRLRLSEDQRRQLRALQSKTDTKLERLLTVEQRRQLNEAHANLLKDASGLQTARQTNGDDKASTGEAVRADPWFSQNPVFRAYRFTESDFASANRHASPERGDSVTDLIKEVSDRHSQIRSLWIKYRLTNPAAHDVKRFAEITLAAKGACRYEQMRHFVADQPSNDLNDYECYYDGSHYDISYPFRRTVEVAARLAVPPYINKIRMHSFFAALSWWPPGDKSSPPQLHGFPVFLLEVLRDPQTRIEAGVVEIDSRPCKLITLHDVDRIWLDVERGVIVRREMFRGSPKVPVARCEFRNFRQVMPDVWLPYSFRREIVSIETGVFEVLKYRINDVDDKLFSHSPGPGTLVIDRDTDKMHQVPGGRSYLDSLCDNALATCTPTSPVSTRRNTTSIIVYAAGVSVGAFLTWFGRRAAVAATKFASR